MATPRVTVLVADDEEDMRLLIRLTLEPAGIEIVAEAADGDEALAQLTRLAPPPIPSVVILDNRMPHQTGIRVAREMRRRFPDQWIILFSAYLTPEVQTAALKAEIDVCVAKHNMAELPALVISMATGPPRVS